MDKINENKLIKMFKSLKYIFKIVRVMALYYYKKNNK